MRGLWTMLALLLVGLTAGSAAAEEGAEGSEETEEAAEEEAPAPDPPDEAAATDDEPAATDDEPTATDKEPAATDDEPAATDDEPAATDDEPAATDEKPSEPAEPEIEAAPVPAVEPMAARTPPPRIDSTARIVASGRVSGAVVVDEGRGIVAPLEIVQIGWPVQVQLGGGLRTRARIVAVDEYEGLALLELDEPAPASHAAVLRTAPPTLGEAVTLIGHGGSPGLGAGDLHLREMLTFSPLHATVTAVESTLGEPADLAPGERPRRFLIDRGPGDGDLGAPIFDADGFLVGLLLEEIEDGGGRALAVDAGAIADLLAEPRLAKSFQRAHHLQSWAGVGIAAHNRPSHLGATLSYGIRGVFLDQLRFEPFVELVLGTRAPSLSAVGPRPRDFWWSVETGVSFGWRIPMFGEGARNYIVPTVGFRAGWNRFEHRVEELVTVCGEGDSSADCALVIDRSVNQERSLRAGVDLGIDIRHGPFRVGYRFFLDPQAVAAHAMHRLLITFDGAGIPLKAGDSN